MAGGDGAATLYCAENLQEDSVRLWSTTECGAFTRSSSCTVAKEDPGVVPFHRSFEYVRHLSSGTYGSTVLVRDHSSSNPALLRVMKIAFADEAFQREVNAFIHTLDNVLAPGISPNFVIPTAWFVCDRLPPNTPGSSWRKMYERITDMPVILDLSSLSSPLPPFHLESPVGVIVMEYGEQGTMRTFYQNVLRKMIEAGGLAANNTLRTTLFQLVTSLYAMENTGLQHRDITSSNVVFTTADVRKGLDSFEALYGRVNPTFDYTYGELKFSLKTTASSTLYVPLLFDYSLSKVIVDYESEQRLCHTVTNPWYRAPELFFFQADESNYYHASDMFSLAISVMEMIIGKHIFTRIPLPYRTVRAFDRMCEHTRGSYASDFIAVQGRYTLPYIWGLFHVLGVPTNADIPGIEQHALYLVLVAEIVATEGRKGLEACGEIWRNNAGELFEQSSSAVDSDLVEVLKSMLEWGPKNRPTSALYLLQRRYFASLRTDHRGVETIQNRLYQRRRRRRRRRNNNNNKKKKKRVLLTPFDAPLLFSPPEPPSLSLLMCV